MIKTIIKEGFPCNKPEEWKVEQCLDELKEDDKEYLVAINYSPIDSDDYTVIIACTENNGILCLEKEFYI